MRKLAFLLLSVAIMASGCGALGASQATPTPALTSKPLARPTVKVARGPIVETVRVFARVAAVREADLYFRKSGRLKTLLVEPGQTVTEGQVLAELDLGDLPQRIKMAEINLKEAQVKLDQASRLDQEARRKLDQETARIAVEQAKVALASAEKSLTAKKAGPGAVEVAATAVKEAELKLESAQQDLIKVQKSDVVSKNVRDREYEHNWYEANYGETLDKFQRGQASQTDVDGAWNNLLTAKERLDSARADAAQAQTNAQEAVLKAQETLDKAKADLQAARTLPEGFQYRDEELAVEQARLALSKAEADYQARMEPGNQDTEIELLKSAVGQAEATLEDLKGQQSGSQLAAPFAGKVTSLYSKPGDQVNEFQTLLTISDPSELQVRGEVMEGDLEKIALGQRAEVMIDYLAGQTLKGTVAGLPKKGASGEKGQPSDNSIQIKVEWPDEPPQMDSFVQASIVVREKQDVLKVPVSAVRTVGRRTFVEYMDGRLRRSANVELGVVTEREAEVLSGLQEGQAILAGQ